MLSGERSMTYLQHPSTGFYVFILPSVASQPFLCQVYLWHGTQVRTGLQIAMNDFNLTFAGSGAGAWVRFRYRGSILSSFMILYVH